MIAGNKITLHTGCLGLPPGEGRSGPEAGKTSTFILYIFSAGVVPEAAPESPFQSHRNLCSYGSPVFPST